MRMKLFGVLAAGAALGLGISTGANANTLVSAFTSDHCTGGCLTGQPSGGTVTIKDIGAGLVEVDVALANGNQFVNTGFQASFGFNLTGITSVTYSNINPAGSTPQGQFFAAPAPLAGAGLPGLIVACGGLLALGRRRRRRRAAVV
jgi:hypothetical protein